MTGEEIRAAIDGLSTIGNDLYDIAHAFDTSDERGRINVDDFRTKLIDLLRQANPETHMWVPMDADGVPIHIGDELCGYGKPDGGVYCMATNGAMVYVGEINDDAPKQWMTWTAYQCRHYHKPTIDDDKAKRKACGIIDAMRFVSSSEYRFSDGCEYFISGPMSGIDGWNKAAFDACQTRIKELSQDGACVLNPASETPVEISSERPHTYYMLHTLHELVRTFYGSNTQMVKAVVLLPGWETSYGAVMEAMVAHECGIDLVLWEE